MAVGDAGGVQIEHDPLGVVECDSMQHGQQRIAARSLVIVQILVAPASEHGSAGPAAQQVGVTQRIPRFCQNYSTRWFQQKAKKQ